MSEGLGDAPVFDEAVVQKVDGEQHCVIVHRAPAGNIVAFHSPLDDGAVACAICTTAGTRVYLRPTVAEEDDDAA